ncbi:hypothetical protein LTS10_005114 [Elasticomyces elasticus]|nr:hypothetical protein LTS10_005114 [Elasticomyces elasticus]
MANSTPNKSLEDFHARLCESQVTLTQTVTSLTHAVTELVNSQNETNNNITELAKSQSKTSNNISDLVKAQSANRQALDGRAMQLKTGSTSSAGRRLTDTYELLEMILLNLPMDTLLFSQRVSRNFCSVIANSKVLQQKLFFAPLPAGCLDQEYRVNSILSRVSQLPLYYCPAAKGLRYSGSSERLSIYLTKPTSKSYTLSDAGPGNDTRRATTPAISWTWLTSHCTYTTKEAVVVNGSWRRMLLTQPSRKCNLNLQLPKGESRRLSADTKLTIEQMLESWY